MTCRAFLTVGLVVAFLATFGCDSTPDSDSKDDVAQGCDIGPNPSTWDALYKVVIEYGKCVQCHSAEAKQGQLDLSKDAAYAALIRVDAKLQTLKTPMQLVYPGEEKLSLLYHKVAGRTLGASMPDGAGQAMPPGDVPAVSEDHLKALRLWIRAGAPEKGVVQGTAKLLKCNVSNDFDPNKIAPPDPPKAGEGIQLLAGPWEVKAYSEDEVCFATYYDFSKPGLVPEWAKRPCPKSAGGPDKTCIAYNHNLLTQDPQSHHSINRIYVGSAGPESSDWGAWTCRGGPHAGKACDPLKIGVPATSGGADCGDRGVCGTATQKSVACTGYGPPGARSKSISLNGSQKPISTLLFAPGVYKVMPIKGIVLWNSHGFNLSKKDTTIEQWIDIGFAKKEEQLYPQRGIFHVKNIFVMNVPPFQQREYCGSWTMPRHGQLTSLGSHVHKRGILFRTWMPPQEPGCTHATGCKPNKDKPAYTSTIYDDPVELVFEKPVPFHGEEAKSRTFKYCAVFDNGSTKKTAVKRRSKSDNALPGGCSDKDVACLNGPKQGELCGGKNSFCDTKPGAGDGLCDACPLRGGVTTEDEMLILLGSYYIKQP